MVIIKCVIYIGPFDKPTVFNSDEEKQKHQLVCWPSLQYRIYARLTLMALMRSSGFEKHRDSKMPSLIRYVFQEKVRSFIHLYKHLSPVLVY